MDHQTLEQIADFICGDGESYPVYRSGSELTRFFQRVGFTNFIHDGSTRKWWTLSALEQLTDNNVKRVILRLANPHEYKGNRKLVSIAINKMNEILSIEGLKIKLEGVNPIIKEITPDFSEEEVIEELKPLPPPDFLKLKIEPGLGDILSERWNETQKCMDSGAYLAATILMGSLLEGILLSVFQKFPNEISGSKQVPKDLRTGKVKYFAEWSFSNMINIAHELGWIDLDVKKFSHSLREFRNLIHPYLQMIVRAFPDKDTCEISWLVVQAATNDLAKKLR